MTPGTVGILNVGAGDIRISFDKSNPVEVIRSRRIVTDMLRRGYALLVEVDRDGQKAFERAIDFDEKTDSYIVADFDPISEQERDNMAMAEREAVLYEGRVPPGKRREIEKELHGESQQKPKTGVDDGPSLPSKTGRSRGRPRKSVPASTTRAVAVGRSAGG